MIEPDRGKALLEAFPGVGRLAAEKIPPERQVLDHAQRGLQRVAMTQIMGKRGFAGSVGAGDSQCLARGGLKIEAREHVPAVPHTTDATSEEPHLFLSRLSEPSLWRLSVHSRFRQENYAIDGTSDIRTSGRLIG